MSEKYHVTYTLETTDHVMRIVADNPRKAALKYCSINADYVINNSEKCTIYVWPMWQYDEVKRFSVNPWFHRTGMSWGLGEK